MRLDLKSNHGGRTVGEVLLFGLCIHGVKKLARNESTIEQLT